MNESYFSAWAESLRERSSRMLTGACLWPEDWEDQVLEVLRDLAETSDTAVMVWKINPPEAPQGQVIYNYAMLEEEGGSPTLEDKEAARRSAWEQFRLRRLENPNSTWVFPAGLRWLYADDNLAERFAGPS